MFEYLEPDASGASNLPPAQPSHLHPHPEKVRHLLYGSRLVIDPTIKILHAYGYADPNDWSEPIPTDQPNQWMAIMTKTLLLGKRHSLARFLAPLSQGHPDRRGLKLLTETA